MSASIVFGVLSVASAQGPVETFPGPILSGYIEGFARNVAAVGDLDGDGISEVAASALTVVDSSGNRVGVVSAFTIANSISKLRWSVILPAVPGSDWVRSIKGVGDVNNDGVPDVGIGVSGVVGYFGTTAVSTFVVSGVDGSLLMNVPQAVSGATPGELVQISGGTDANLDGRMDFAMLEPAGPGFFGAIRMISGVTGQAIWTRLGAEASPLGVECECLGDTDGDGIDEVAFHRYGSLSVEIVSGGSGSTIASGIPPVDGLSHVGLAMERTGDLDFDGIDDICSSWSENPASDVVAVLSGRNLTKLFSFGDPAFFAYTGGNYPVNRDRLAVLPDLTGDGFPDVAIGNQHYVVSQSPNVTGAARIYSGRTGSPQFTITTPQPANGGQFAFAIAGSDDLNGDGAGDIIVGTVESYYGPAGPSGAVHVFSGHCGSSILNGTGCPGSGGSTPTMSLTGCPAPACTVTLGLQGYSGGQPVIFLMGTQVTASPMPGGCTLLVAPPHIVVTSTTPYSSPGAGALLIPIEVPNIALSGSMIAMQALFIDPFVPRGYSASNAVIVSF